MRFCTSVVALLIFLPACSAVRIHRLATRNQQCTATPEGRQFEQEVVRAFWGDASFMRECAPTGSPVTDPLTIYVEVKTDGRMGTLAITPDTQVARCIRAHVMERQFPLPATVFVAKIDLQFTE